MANTTNIKIGAVSVNFDGTDLGHTMGGAVFNYAPEYADILADQFGNTPVDKALLGEVVTVKVSLAESIIANFNVAMPASTLAGGSSGRATIGRDAGYRLSSVAGELILHPLVNDASDLSDDIVLHKAVVMDEVEVPFNNEDERVFEVTFVALVDTTKSDGNYLGFVGDSTD